MNAVVKVRVFWKNDFGGRICSGVSITEESNGFACKSSSLQYLILYTDSLTPLTGSDDGKAKVFEFRPK